MTDGQVPRGADCDYAGVGHRRDVLFAIDSTYRVQCLQNATRGRSARKRGLHCLFRCLDKLEGWLSECLSEGPYGIQGWRFSATLKNRDVGPMQPSAICK